MKQHSEQKETHAPHLPRLWGSPIYIPLFALALVFVGMVATSIWLLVNPLTNNVGILIILATFLFGIGVLVYLHFTVQKNLLSPLASLQDWANNLQRGKLSARLPKHGSQVFDDLAKQINQLSDKLQALTEDMQSQVKKQTLHIAQKTRSLEIIYDVAASINVSRDLDDLLTRFLHTLKDVVKARAAVVRLVTDDNQMRLVASTGLSPEVIEREQLIPAASCLCGSALDEGSVQYQFNIEKCDKIIGHSFFDDDNVAMIAVPLQYRDKTLGVYNLFIDNDMVSDVAEVNDLLTSIGRHLGMAIDKARLDDETNRLSIMEERTRLAHELHDSLAQTLASLRFQARVLDENLRKGEEPAVWHELEKIEINLDEAYSELRELITHFRAPIDKRGLVPAVEHLTKRFKAQTGIHIFLQQEWNIVQLPPSIEVEVLRIIQESLNNIRKHSQAHTVRVILRSSPQGECHILIEDDGVGMEGSDGKDKTIDHYGLNIMQERAKRINGVLKIESEPGEGTRITLTFNHHTAQQISDKNSSKVFVQLPGKQVGL